MAELSSHKNHRVRRRCCEMISHFLINLPDRYDHTQRLLPYLLSFVNDIVPATQRAALQCLETCGQREHPDEVLEKRQYGVDGEDAIDYNNELPAPFTARPGLGARLFVRANTDRFFRALLGELSHWKEHTRRRSAELLLTLTVYCEEHLAKYFHHTIDAIAKVGANKRKALDQHDPTLATTQKIIRSLTKYLAGDEAMAIELARVQTMLDVRIEAILPLGTYIQSLLSLGEAITYSLV